MHCNRDRLRTLLSPFHTAKTQSRHLTLARVIGVECVILSLIAAFVLV